MRILLFISCYLLPLMVLAQNNESQSIVSANTSSQKILIEEDIDQGGLAGKHLAQISLANKNNTNSNVTNGTLNSQSTVIDNSIGTSPVVGKHVLANMDAGSMILSLLMVLALIIICAFVLKRFNFAQQGISQLKIVTSLSLGTKERVMVVQVGEEQLLLGVTAGQITLLDKLSEPLSGHNNINKADLPLNILSFLSAKKS